MKDKDEVISGGSGESASFTPTSASSGDGSSSITFKFDDGSCSAKCDENETGDLKRVPYEAKFTVVGVEITGVNKVCVVDTAQMTAVGTPSGGTLSNWKTSEPSVVISAEGVIDPRAISDTYSAPGVDVTVDYTLGGCTVTSKPFKVLITRTPLHNWQEYVKCGRLVVNPAYTPSSDGCTGFPDNPARGAHTSFTPACNEHDICYDTCATPKDRCDRDFRNRMEAICNAARPLDGQEVYEDCMWYADKYFRTASAIDRYYRAAQINACVCCD